ncbi:MAG: hypothetical protein JWM41_1105 [Gemmatimonadetes bacterium]|nr:hypothetical protein [Gemmatimonadota bacterium]
MRAATDRVLAPIEPVVVKVDVSPAIRAFRVQLSDTATIDRVADRIRSSASVEDVSPDDCSMHVQRPASPQARSR